MTVGFLVGSYLTQSKHYDSLIQCITSILTFHSNPIVVIFNSLSDKSLTRKAIETYKSVPQVTIIIDPSEISACNLVYKYLYEEKYFDTSILLQDSMFLNRPLPLDELESTEVMFLWHFTNHRVHWSTIKEPATDYNKAHNIFTHDDLILDAIHSYSHKSDFVKYCDAVYHRKHLWVGSFGFCSIIQLRFLEKLEAQTDILNILINMNDNRQRRASESIFPLACNFVLGRMLTDSFDGLYYDGVGYINNNKGTYFSKISFGR